MQFNIGNMEPRQEPQHYPEAEMPSIIVDESAFHHEDDDKTRVFESPAARAAMDARVREMAAQFSKRETMETLNELKSMIEDRIEELAKKNDDASREDITCLETALEAVENGDPETAHTWLQNLDESAQKGMMLGQLESWKKKMERAN